MPPVTTISGVSSGIDWQATVDALMQVEQRKVTLLENRQSFQQQKLDVWRSLNTRLLSLKSSMDSLEEASDFLVKSATSSNGDQVEGSATTNATTGTHRVMVDQLAAATRMVHQGVADANTTAVNASGENQVLAYTYGSGGSAVNVSLTVPDGTTLQGLRDLINQDSANPGIRASLLNDGSGGANAWHLVLVGADTGQEAQLTVDDGLTTLGGGSFDTASFSVTQSPQNARFRVDGYPPSSWMESSTNSVTNAIEGLNLTLKESTAGADVLITISQDSSAIKGKLAAFVTSYNEIITQINATTTYNATTKTMGVLLGDSSVNQLKRGLSQVATRPPAGLDGDAHFTTMSQVGVKTGVGGLLSIDETKLDAALADHPEELAALFTFSTRSDSPAFSFFTRTATVPGGDVAVSATYDGDGALLGATLNGTSAAVEGDLILAPEGSALFGLRLLFRNPGDGPGVRSGTVTLAHGVASALTRTLTELTDSTSGMVQFQTGRLEDAVVSLQDSIENMNVRLTSKREQLMREYLAMESAITRMQSQAGSLGSLSS